MARKIFVTGGLGFIGIHLCKRLLEDGASVTCYDNIDPKTTNPTNNLELEKYTRYRFEKGDLLDFGRLEDSLNGTDAIIHLAAISGVDRSIKNPQEVIYTNTIGTLNVLEAARKKGVERLHFVSTDEVFGHAVTGSFSETSQINPRNPYAAGKAGGESICLAWGITYDRYVTITNSVNNYGPYQAPEKLIPRLTVRGILGKTLPVYGTGEQLREWLYVDDHVDAILCVLEKGKPNERYCIGSQKIVANIEIVRKIIETLSLSRDVIEYVEDRKGHDLRYAIDSSKLRDLGWKPTHDFDTSLTKTIRWYVENRAWWEYFRGVYEDLA